MIDCLAASVPWRAGRTWAVLASAILVNVVVAGFATGYLRLLVSEVQSDLGLSLGQWGCSRASPPSGRWRSGFPEAFSGTASDSAGSWLPVSRWRAWRFLGNVREMGPETPGVMFAVASVAFMVGCAILPALSDRIGLRKPVYIVAMLAAAGAVLAQVWVVGAWLVVVNVIWGLSASASVLLFVVPVETKRIGPALAGTACAATGTAGALGLVVLGLIGWKLAGVSPKLTLALFAGCLALSGLLFAAVRETGPRAPSRGDSPHSLTAVTR